MSHLAKWPAREGDPERVRRFQESPYWPDRAKGTRGHDVSEFWDTAASRIETIPGPGSISVLSGSAYLSPREVEEARRQRTAQPGRAKALARAIGRVVPRGFWNRVWAPVEQAAQAAREARTDKVAEQAFEKMAAAQPEPLFRTVADLRSVPVLADQVEGSRWMTLYVASALNVLAPHMRAHKPRTILEIGPGWSILPIALHHQFGGKFILVDLPEVLSAAFTMIQHYRSDARILLPHEVERVEIGPDAPDFTLLCPEQASLIPDGSVDMAVNMSSFQEMNYPLIEGYFTLITRVVKEKGLFYCLNETAFRRHRTGGAVEFAKYPWNPKFTDVIHREFEFGRLSESYGRMHRLQIKSKR